MPSSAFVTMETMATPVASPSINVDTADRRAHKGRQRILSLILLLAGLHGICYFTLYVNINPPHRAYLVSHGSCAQYFIQVCAVLPKQQRGPGLRQWCERPNQRG